MADTPGPKGTPSSRKKPGHKPELMNIATASAASIVADGVLKKPVGPGLDRQPKTLNTVGINSILKTKREKAEPSQKQRDSDAFRKVSDDVLKRTKSNASLGSEKSRQSIRKSVSQLARKRSSSVDSLDKARSSIFPKDKDGSPGQSPHGGSTSSLDRLPMDEDGNWDMFVGDDDGDAAEEELLETEPAFEMAVVEIDVNEALEEMDKILKKALSQARVTDREKTILYDKFGLLLQALVSYQESEVEVIDNLRMKTAIMDVLTAFTATEVEVGSTFLQAEDGGPGEQEEAKAEEDKAPAAAEQADDEEGHKSHKDSQGISIDEMAAITVRETLLVQKNKLEMQENMRMVHLLELKQLEFEKTLLAIHYSRMVKPSDLIKEMKDLRKAVNDLKLELSSIQNELSQLQLDISSEEKGVKDDEVVVDRWDLDVLTKQMDVQQGANKPVHMAREADREAHRLEQIQDLVDALSSNLVDGWEAVRDIQVEVDSVHAELNALIREEGRMAQHRKLSLHETEALMADLEAMGRREQSLLDRCANTTERLATAAKTRKQLYEDLHHIHNDANRALREYQKLERTIRLAQDAHINAKLAYDKMRAAFDATRPKDDSNNWEKLNRMFHREIANLKLALSKKLDEASIKSAQVDKLQRRLNELYEDQIECGKELQELIRTTVRKRREREEKSEQCIKLEAQVFKILSDKKMQQLVLDDCARTERDLFRAIEVVREQYTKMKIERASVMNDLIAARQKVTEQGEKLKICNNEIESYTNQCLDREREILRTHYLNLNAQLARDSVRNEALRCINKYRFYRTERDELHLCNKTMRKEIGRQGVEVAMIRERFEKASQESNQKAILVRERTEEVCTFIERMKSYEMILLTGQGHLTTRELEKAKLESILAEAKTHLLVVTSNQPDEGKIFEEIETLRTKFLDITAERRALEVEMNNVYDKSRVREIHHNWIEERETVPLLKVKIDRLEGLLATRDCRILERALTLKQVEVMTEGSIEQACWLKKRYEGDVKALVSIRKSLYHLSAKIDGMICEASLAISQADSSESHFMALKKKYIIAEMRFELGLPPNREMESAWNHNFWQTTMMDRARNRPPGFLKTFNRPKGSQIVMERFRPKRRQEDEPIQLYRCQTIPSRMAPAVKACPAQPYVPSRRPLKGSKTDLLRQKTGLALCDLR